jgi:hypothetical protein
MHLLNRRWLKRRRSLLALALLYTLLNVPKPLTVDDAAYYYFARHIASDPLHPYGFEMLWNDFPVNANQVLAPPVLPYWWSLGLRLFGDRPWMWKLWLFPFAMLFVVALHALFRRFARGLEQPLLWLTVLSPMFLPSLNLMLDVPALALGLSALAVFFRGCGRRAGGVILVVLSGLLAGLAMQTKYTAFLVPPVMLLYALLFRRLPQFLIASGLAVAIFASWELFIYWQHGQSHFLNNLPSYRDRQEWLDDKFWLVVALLPMLGGVAPGLILLGLLASGGQRPWLILMGLVLACGYAEVAGLDMPPVVIAKTFFLERPLEQEIFGTFGVLVAAIILVVGWDLCVPFDREETEELSKGRVTNLPRRSYTLFLFGWLLLEFAGYFVLTPFPAARRVMGLVVVSTLLIGRFAANTGWLLERKRLVNGVAGAGIGFGFLFCAVDFIDACVQKEMPEAAAQWIREQPVDEEYQKSIGRGPIVWYVGHWGFQFYAERAGMQPVVLHRSLLIPGDWLVVPEKRWEQQVIQIDPDYAQAETILEIADRVPLRTVRCFYGGYVPLEHQAGPRMQATIYRITKPWLPRLGSR